jgi:pseudaminic acid cytidylyltransferase
MENRIIAVIPARGGSKRIPRKNIRAFCGKPMIAWPIEAARAAGIFDRILVSTDDREIADIAVQWGGEVPFTRPSDLADDYVGTTEVVGHAAQWARQQGWPVASVCCIYATAALLRAEDLVLGFKTLESGKWRYVFSATEFPTSIFRAMQRLPAGGTRMVFPQHERTRSQDLAPALYDAAQFYWGSAQTWIDKAMIFDEFSTQILIPKARSVDIDSLEDWALAESLFQLPRR